MTEVSSPTTGPAPMFDTGPHPHPTPTTEPHSAPIFDTGPHPNPLQPLGLEFEFEPEPTYESEPHPHAAQAFSEPDNVDTDAFLRSVTGYLDVAAAPLGAAAQPVLVPSSYLFVKRWKFALIVAGVWLVAAGAGLGFYYWWYASMDKTLPVFAIMLYLGVCMVASLLVSMVPNRPQVAALSIAVMSAPLASTATAAVLHGAYYFEWIARPALG